MGLKLGEIKAWDKKTHVGVLLYTAILKGAVERDHYVS